MIYTLCFILMAVGLYGIVAKKNLVKIVISLLILEHGIHLFLILIGYAGEGSVPPIHDPQTMTMVGLAAADPLPQALVLTSIVIGLGVLALLVSLSLRLYDRYGTFDVSEMRRLKG